MRRSWNIILLPGVLISVAFEECVMNAAILQIIECRQCCTQHSRGLHKRPEKNTEESLPNWITDKIVVVCRSSV